MAIHQMNNFDLNLLRVFDAIWRERHVSRAAKAVGLSQPAMSSALRRLRDRLGDPLFVSTRRGMLPTPFASQLASDVSELLQRIQLNILAPPHFSPATATRLFRIGASDLGETAFMPRLLARFEQVAPRLRLNTWSDSQPKLMDALETGELDLVIGHFPQIAGADLLQRSLSSHDFICLARAEHPLVKNGIIEADDFLNASHVTISHSPHQETVDAYLTKGGMARRIIYACSHFMSIPVVVAYTDLIATVPKEAGNIFRDYPGIQQAAAPFAFTMMPVRMYWHRRSHSDEASRWLREAIISLTADTPPPSGVAHA